MPRKVKDVVVVAEGRDHGKTFRLYEMDAVRAEEWGLRALTVMNRSGVELPDERTLGAGMVAVMLYGVKALLSANFDDAKPLLDEMMDCVHFVPAPALEPKIERGLVDSDTEEIATRLWLRDRVIELHTGFSTAAAFSTLKALATAQTSNPPSPSTSQSD